MDIRAWLKSRTFWIILVFVVLSLALWAQRSFLPQAPLPGWVDAVVDLVGGALLVWARAVTTGPVGGGGAELPVPVSPQPSSPQAAKSPVAKITTMLLLGALGLLLGGCGTLSGPAVVEGAGTVLRVASGACSFVTGLEGVRQAVDRQAFTAACAAGPSDSVIVTCQDIDQGDAVSLVFVGKATCEACIRPDP